jgi:hypothetical protein
LATLPSAVALDLTIGPTITSGEHQANYSAIQTAINDMLSVLSSGTSGAQYFNGNGSSVTFVSGPTPSFSTTLPTATDGAEAVHVDSISAPTHMWRLRYVAAALKWYPQAGSWGYGTSLPSVPSFVDKVRFTLVDSVTLPTYQWEFQYNAGSSNTDKWEFVGGSALYATVDTPEATASTSYTNLATVGPTLTAPRSGLYLFTVEYRAVAPGTSSLINANMHVNGSSSAVDGYGAITLSNCYHAASFTRPLNVNAGDTLQLKYQTAQNTVTFQTRWLLMRPVRVS